MQLYSLQTKAAIEVPDAQVERTTMANGCPVARATVERDGKTLKLFTFLPNDAAPAPTVTTAPAAQPKKAKK